jgi:Fe-S-cluster containining protein
VAVGKQTRFTVSTSETIVLGPDITGTLSLSQELNQKGVIASLPRLDAGYRGPVAFSAFNSSIRTIDVAKGEPVVELVLERVTDAAAPTAQEPEAPVPVQGIKAPMKGMHLDPRDSGLPCLDNGCSNCCHGTEMPLTDNDIKRLQAQGHDNFWDESDGWRTLKNVDGKCMFLDDKGRCSIYKERPVGCTFYPAVFSMDENGAILDHECPYRYEFAVTETLSKDISVLVETVQRERRQRRRRNHKLMDIF